MKFCSNCGAQLDDGTKFCTECGQKIQQVTPQVPVAAPPEQAVDPAPVAKTSVQIYGQPVNHSFSEPVITETEQGVLHTYGAPVNHNFTPPIQTQSALCGTYGGDQAAAIQPEPVRKPEPVTAPVRPEPVRVPEPPVTAPATQSPETGSYTAPVTAPSKPPKPSREKTGGKKLPMPLMIGIAAVVVVILIVVIFGGGGGDKNDPNLGLYNGVSSTYDGMELGAEGEWIELKSGGKANLMLMGEEYSAKWKLDGESFVLTQAGDEFVGTLKDGTLVLDFGGIIYTYVNEAYEAPVPQDTSAIQETDIEKPGKEEPDQVEPESQPASSVGSVVGYWTLLKAEGDSDMAMDEETVQTLKSLGIEIYLDLKADGTGVFLLEDLINISWDEKELTDDFGNTYAYNLTDNQLTVEVEGTTMYFVPGEGDAPAVNVPGEEEPGTDIDDPILNFWEGDWYGWWVIWSGDGYYADMEDDGWEAFAHIDVNEDYTGTVTLWDTDTTRDDPLAVVEVSFRSGVSEYGTIISESGWFINDEVEHADWNCDVGASMVRMFDSMIAIDSYYYDPDNPDDGFNYVFILRPWGMDWEDVRGVDAEGTYYSDMMPFEYDSWYLPLIESGVDYLPDSYEAGLELIG